MRISGCDNSGPLHVEPTAVTSEPSLQGERLRPPKQSVMKSRLPKRMVSPREKSSRDRHSPLAVAASGDEGTIGTSRGKSTLQIPLPSMPTVNIFYTSKNRVVNIVRSSSEMVLRTTKHIIIYPSSGPSLEVITLRPVV
jgi:hypothetical protein